MHAAQQRTWELTLSSVAAYAGGRVVNHGHESLELPQLSHSFLLLEPPEVLVGATGDRSPRPERERPELTGRLGGPGRVCASPPEPAPRDITAGQYTRMPPHRAGPCPWPCSPVVRQLDQPER